MILHFPREALVVIEEQVIATLSRYAHTGESATEAGGILIGCYRGPHVEVCGCTVPMTGDIRRHHLFDRKDCGHDRAAKKAWRQSDRTRTFVGEWHTHPEDHPTPSWLDRRTWHQVMRSHRDGPVLFLIAGRRECWAGLGVDGEIQPAEMAEAEGREAFHPAPGSRRPLGAVPPR